MIFGNGGILITLDAIDGDANCLLDLGLAMPALLLTRTWSLDDRETGSMHHDGLESVGEIWRYVLEMDDLKDISTLGQVGKAPEDCVWYEQCKGKRDQITSDFP